MYDVSYNNLVLYDRVLPTYEIKKKGKDKDKKFDASKDANNPENSKDEPDEVVVR